MLPIPIKAPGFHSERSPSTAHRWRLCIGSVEEERGLPDNAGEEAIQGTVFHDFAADCAEIGLEPWHMIGDRMLCEDGQYREFTKEMATKMMPGLDLIWALADTPGAILFVEKRVNLHNWVGEGESGTADVFIFNVSTWTLITFDWKWGAGVPVQPELNDQAMLYTGGVWDTYAEDAFREAFDQGLTPWETWREARDNINVTIIIEQPRAPGGGGVWNTTMGFLFKELKKIRADADKTLIPGQPRTPGEKQCKFCKAAAYNACKARVEYIAEKTGMLLDELEDDLMVGAEIELHDRRALTPEQRSQIILNEKLITGWLNSLKEEAMVDAKVGRPVPGLKRVKGRNPARSWADEQKAEIILKKELQEEAFLKKLRSPAQVEDEVGKQRYKAKFEAMVATGEAKPILVPETDPRDRMYSDEELLDEEFGDSIEDLI